MSCMQSCNVLNQGSNVVNVFKHVPANVIMMHQDDVKPCTPPAVGGVIDRQLVITHAHASPARVEDDMCETTIAASNSGS